MAFRFTVFGPLIYLQGRKAISISILVKTPTLLGISRRTFSNWWKVFSVFGKTMKNLRNQRKCELVKSGVKFRKLVPKTSFKSFTIFHEEVVAVLRNRVELFLNRTIYVEFAILDVSKTLMYEFSLNSIKQKYPGDRSKLLITDTGFLKYSIQTANLY